MLHQGALSLPELVAKYTEGVDGSHDIAHLQRVVANCTRLSAAEALPPGEARLALAAAWCHDLDDKKYGGTDALDKARRVLTACAEAFSADEVERVCGIIQGVSFTGERAGSSGSAPDRLTAIVQDADRLDAIGAHGIARCFAFGGARSRPLAESVQHFHDKLLLLRGMMKTAVGRAEAESRHAYMVAFLAQLAREESA